REKADEAQGAVQHAGILAKLDQLAVAHLLPQHQVAAVEQDQEVADAQKVTDKGKQRVKGLFVAGADPGKLLADVDKALRLSLLLLKGLDHPDAAQHILKQRIRPVFSPPLPQIGRASC